MPIRLCYPVSNLSVQPERRLLDAEALSAEYLVGEVDRVFRRVRYQPLLVYRRQAEAEIDAEPIEEDLDLLVTRGWHQTWSLLTPGPFALRVPGSYRVGDERQTNSSAARRRAVSARRSSKTRASSVVTCCGAAAAGSRRRCRAIGTDGHHVPVEPEEGAGVGIGTRFSCAV